MNTDIVKEAEKIVLRYKKRCEPCRGRHRIKAVIAVTAALLAVGTIIAAVYFVGIPQMFCALFVAKAVSIL